MKAAILLSSLFAIAMLGTEALAEPACKTTTLKNAAPTLAEMYAMAERHAKAWKPDAVLVSISNTMLGPLQPDGSAAAWHLVFYSESAKSWASIDTFRGSLTCTANAGSAGRIPDLKPDFVRDGALLYGIARQHGEALIANGHGVMIGTAAAPSNRHATWNVSYQKDGGKDGGILVLVDANTGKVEKVLK
jgi:hypothetical protein